MADIEINKKTKSGKPVDDVDVSEVSKEDIVALGNSPAEMTPIERANAAKAEMDIIAKKYNVSWAIEHQITIRPL